MIKFADKPVHRIFYLGKIKCETDSYELLQRSIPDKWNTSLKNMTGSNYWIVQEYL